MRKSQLILLAFLFFPVLLFSQEVKSTGTGFFVSENGLIVTCAHVIEDGNSIKVRIANTEYEAQVISKNVEKDLALLKINYRNPYHFKIVNFSTASLGDKLYVLGFPLSDLLGTDIRLTDGIVSARSGINSDQTYFQLSAPVQPGNSGGPIINSNFNVIGVAAAKLNDMATLVSSGSIPQNINFAIKSEYARLLGSQNFNNINIIRSIQNAINATVQIISDPNNISVNNTQRSTIIIQVNYIYVWDLIHYTLTNLRIEFIDSSTGNVVGSGVHSGSSFSSANTITRNVLNQMLNKM